MEGEVVNITFYYSLLPLPKHYIRAREYPEYKK
jgi:hypothetical protein